LTAIGSDLNGTPTLVGKIEIDPVGMLSDAGKDDPLGIKLRAGVRGDRGRSPDSCMHHGSVVALS
jgi:hypothetical protein